MKSVGASVSRPHSSALTVIGEMMRMMDSDIVVAPASKREVRVDALEMSVLVVMRLSLEMSLLLRGWIANNDDEDDDDVAELIVD